MARAARAVCIFVRIRNSSVFWERRERRREGEVREGRGGKGMWICIVQLCVFVRLFVCFCICIFVSARLCIHVCICGSKFWVGSGPPSWTPETPPRLFSPDPARQSYKQSQTDIRRNITQNRNPVDFSFPFVTWPRPVLRPGGQAHNMFTSEIQDGICCDNPCVRMVNPTPMQLGGSAKRCNPVYCVHMTKPETLAIMLQSHECDTVFGAACKYLCEGLVEKVSWWEETDRASLKHCNVEFRIAQDGAVLYLFWKR